MMNSLMNTHTPVNFKNYNNNNNDGDDSNLSSFSYSSYSPYPSYPSYPSYSSYLPFPPLSSFYSSPSPSFKITDNNQLQETTIVIPAAAVARTNLTSTAKTKRVKKTSSSSSLTALPSTRQILLFRPSIAMTLPTEIIHEIFNYLEE